MRDEPELIEDVKDAYLAATAEHLCALFGLAVPAWVECHGRPLKRAFFAGGLESLKAILTVESPSAFRRRLLFVGKDALDRPRRLANPPPHRPALAITSGRAVNEPQTVTSSA